MKDDYVLFKRKDKKNWYFYYWKNGRRVVRSTGKRLKKDAKSYVESFLIEEKREKTLFKNFAHGFFDWDKSPWIKKQLEYGRKFSK